MRPPADDALHLSLLLLLVAATWSSSSGAAAGGKGGSIGGSKVSVPYKSETHREPVRSLYEEEGFAVCAKYKGRLATACKHGVTAAAQKVACEPAEKEESRGGAEVRTDAEKSEDEAEFAEEGEEGEEEEGEMEFTETDTAISLMLLGFTGFTMSVFTMAHHHDTDMRFYCWYVISMTVSIFVAVLLFEGCNGALETFMDRMGISSGTKFTVFTVEMLGFYIASQVVTASVCGIFSNEAPFVQGRKGYKSSGAHGELSIQEQRNSLERRVKCWATLLSHMTAFAAIRCGMFFLEADFFTHHPICTFLIGAIMLWIHIALVNVLRKFRKSVFVRHQSEAGDGYVRLTHEVNDHMLLAPINGKTYALTLWDEELYEAGNEVIGLCVSFLLVQACKFNINHVYDITEAEQVAPGGLWKLLIVAALFAGGTGVSVLVHAKLKKGVEEEGTEKRVFSRRLALISQNTMAMAVSWTMLAFAKWGVATTLDWLADLECTGESADLVIFHLISSMGMAVGFTWEQAFHLGVEVVAVQVGTPVVGQLILAFAVATICIVPWRRFILSKTLTLSKERLLLYGNKETAVKQMEEQTKEDTLAHA